VRSGRRLEKAFQYLRARSGRGVGEKGPDLLHPVEHCISTDVWLFRRAQLQYKERKKKIIRYFLSKRKKISPLAFGRGWGVNSGTRHNEFTLFAVFRRGARIIESS